MSFIINSICNKVFIHHTVWSVKSNLCLLGNITDMFGHSVDRTMALLCNTIAFISLKPAHYYRIQLL